MNAINCIAERHGLPVIYSTHPRSMKFIEQRKFTFHPLVQNLKPFGFIDYVKLQKNAFCVLSDSGTLSEESAILGFPAVLIRTSTERPEVLDAGTIIVGSISEKEVAQSVDLARELHKNNGMGTSVDDYADGNVSDKVARIVQSYTGIVNHVVWRK